MQCDGYKKFWEVNGAQVVHSTANDWGWNLNRSIGTDLC